MAVGPELSTTYTDLMLEAKDELQRNYSKSSVLATQLKRVNPTRREFDGVSVRVPLIRNIKQGTAAATESGTLVGPRNIRTTKVSIGLGLISHIVQVSKRLKKVSDNSVVSFAKALELEMSLAEESMSRSFNEILNGAGDGLIAAVTGADGASGGATQDLTVGTTANFFQLYVGRVVDVLTRSTLARATGATAAVRITAVNESTGKITVVFDDDSATSFAGASTHGIYIEGVVGQTPGATSVPQGIQQAAAVTGTFETLAKGTNADWQGVDGRNADTTAADLSISIMDGCIRRRGRNGVPDKQLWLADPAVLDKFSQTLLTQSRWAGDKETLDTGFEYLNYRGERLFPEYDAKPARICNVPLDDIEFYATQSGPDWDDEDGTMFKRFGRNLPIESWLIDEVQLGVRRCNRFVFADNLNQAA